MRYVIDKGTYQEIIRDDKSLFQCPWCGEWFRGLAYHTRQKHGVTAKQLRQKFGLKADYQLITPDLKERHRIIALENSESHIKRNLIEKGTKTRYPKGCKGHTRDTWSAQALAEYKVRQNAKK
jgi:uncharacterized C2H2 Zn-finger protein